MLVKLTLHDLYNLNPKAPVPVWINPLHVVAIMPNGASASLTLSVGTDAVRVQEDQQTVAAKVDDALFYIHHDLNR